MNVDCPKYQDGMCLALGAVAGEPVPIQVDFCAACLASVKPREANNINVGAAFAYFYGRGEPGKAREVYYAVTGTEPEKKEPITLENLGDGMGRCFFVAAGWQELAAPNCLCRDHLEMMNRWDTERCQRNRFKICRWMVEVAEKNGLSMTLNEASSTLDRALEEYEKGTPLG